MTRFGSNGSTRWVFWTTSTKRYSSLPDGAAVVAKNVRTGERVNRARQNKHCRFAFMAARIFGQKIARHFFDFWKITRIIRDSIQFFAAGDISFHFDPFARDQTDAAKIQIIVK